MYSHFYNEHTKGHHKNVATPEDPATARINESIYEFIFRSVVG
jgi:alkane 1-monooxygenase